ncbi:hypothetical protein DWY42_15940 [Bacteroides sp. AF25-18]|nr:hypothetical protein DWY42_15940 [Bacteroides sp. AF25-18]
MNSNPIIHLDPTKTNQGLYKQALIYFYPPRKVMQETLFHQCNHCLKKIEEYHIIQHNKLKPFIALYSLTHPEQPLFIVFTHPCTCNIIRSNYKCNNLKFSFYNEISPILFVLYHISLQ